MSFVNALLIICIIAASNFSAFYLMAQANKVLGKVTGIGGGIGNALKGAGRRGTKNRVMGAIHGTNKLSQRSLVPRSLPGLGKIRFGKKDEEGNRRSLNDRLDKLNKKTAGFWVSPLRRGAAWNKGGISGSVGAVGVAAASRIDKAVEEREKSGKKVGRVLRALQKAAGGKSLIGRKSANAQELYHATHRRAVRQAAEEHSKDAGSSPGDEAATHAASVSDTEDQFIDNYLEYAGLDKDNEQHVERAREAMAHYRADHDDMRIGSDATKVIATIEHATNKTNADVDKDGISEEATQEMYDKLFKTLLPAVASGKMRKVDLVNLLKKNQERIDQSGGSWGDTLKFVISGLEQMEATDGKSATTEDTVSTFVQSVLKNAGAGKIAGSDWRAAATLVPHMSKHLLGSVETAEKAHATAVETGDQEAIDKAKHTVDMAYGDLAGFYQYISSMPEVNKDIIDEHLLNKEAPGAGGGTVLERLNEYDLTPTHGYLLRHKTWLRTDPRRIPGPGGDMTAPPPEHQGNEPPELPAAAGF
jgi:hypothetical protein